LKLLPVRQILLCLCSFIFIVDVVVAYKLSPLFQQTQRQT